MSSRGPNIAPLSIRNSVRAGTHTLVIDLRKVTFMDSTGLRVLIVAGTLCEEMGHELRIIPGEDIQRILEISGLDRVLPFTSR